MLVGKVCQLSLCLFLSIDWDRSGAFVHPAACMWTLWCNRDVSNTRASMQLSTYMSADVQ